MGLRPASSTVASPSSIGVEASRLLHGRYARGFCLSGSDCFQDFGIHALFQNFFCEKTSPSPLSAWTPKPVTFWPLQGRRIPFEASLASLQSEPMRAFCFLLFAFRGFSVPRSTGSVFTAAIYSKDGVSCGLLPLLTPSKLYNIVALASPELHLRFACCRLLLFLKPSVVMARVKQTVAPRDDAPVEEVEYVNVETVPEPEDNEVIVFEEFFSAGLRMPPHLVLVDILLKFRVQLHQLTPNAIVQLSKYFWVVASFEGVPFADGFIKRYELYYQPKKMEVDGVVLEA
jgi:hypothetical protein